MNGVVQPIAPYTQSVYTIPFSLSYEADLFGRVRRNVEAANASLQSTAADLGNVQLVLTAEFAADYFTLRELDAEYKVVRNRWAISAKAWIWCRDRHNGGIASGLEVAQQAAVLDSTDLAGCAGAAIARAVRACDRRAGRPAGLEFQRSCFAAERALRRRCRWEFHPTYLERRPDIATNEREMAYENAQVGLARTAFYPHITLSGGGGWQSTDLSSTF